MKSKITKTALVTGCTSGIGLETCIGLAKQNFNLILISRSDEKLSSLSKEIIGKYGIKTKCFVCDLSSLKDINKMCIEICNYYNHIDVIINNAGAIYMDKQFSVDGLEMTFALNHMSYFALTTNLLENLHNIDDLRIINVSSQAHRNIKIDLDGLDRGDNYNGWFAYKKSKLANIYFTYYMAKKLLGKSITVNCLHPGVVNTNIANNNEKLYYKIITSIIKYFSISAKEGAQTSIYLATNDLVSNVTGLYFKNCRPIKTSKVSYDEKVALELWKKSKRILEKISA
ncbi:MAG: short-chain dehydrogenase [Gammaproteobacteria bacterium]|nr:short-chain dehydrogenase [Gammaproteobacteria bacterium]|tara:strand:+ start:55 stop:909 length:855 start_codon:yes stop_codon:yes gene_type:complete